MKDHDRVHETKLEHNLFIICIAFYFCFIHLKIGISASITGTRQSQFLFLHKRSDYGREKKAKLFSFSLFVWYPSENNN